MFITRYTFNYISIRQLKVYVFIILYIYAYVLEFDVVGMYICKVLYMYSTNYLLYSIKHNF